MAETEYVILVEKLWEVLCVSEDVGVDERDAVELGVAAESLEVKVTSVREKLALRVGDADKLSVKLAEGVPGGVKVGVKVVD